MSMENVLRHIGSMKSEVVHQEIVKDTNIREKRQLQKISVCKM